ncbi:VanZ family protein [Streptomyces sp. NPDC058486]|uniref:VanZ family protein n=1 Tax=unclassified Streptomyces TaxID=2593676 RepID=UPI003651E333
MIGARRKAGEDPAGGEPKHEEPVTPAPGAKPKPKLKLKRKPEPKAKPEPERKPDPEPKPNPAPEPRSEVVPPGPRRPNRFIRALVAVAALACMVAFAVVLARLTLAASPASVPLTHSNLTPGRSIESYLGRPGFVETVEQLGGNILLGVPFGILLPLLSRRARGFLRVAFATAATMLLVELVQGALITGRAFDIDDVLLNTAGALLGYVIVGRRLGRFVHPRTRPRWWQRRRLSEPST